MEIPQRTLGIDYCHNLFYGYYLFDVPSFGDGPDLRFFSPGGKYAGLSDPKEVVYLGWGILKNKLYGPWNIWVYSGNKA